MKKDFNAIVYDILSLNEYIPTIVKVAIKGSTNDSLLMRVLISCKIFNIQNFQINLNIIIKNNIRIKILSLLK